MDDPFVVIGRFIQRDPKDRSGVRRFEGLGGGEALEVTLAQLLQHQAGLPANADYDKFSDAEVNQLRDALTRETLAKPPKQRPGTRFEYSNLGYIIAGHMAEKVTGETWEKLMSQGLFEPLQMSSAGFGPPGTPGKVDQPWGHVMNLGIVRQALQANMALYDALHGLVHCASVEEEGGELAEGRR